MRDEIDALADLQMDELRGDLKFVGDITHERARFIWEQYRLDEAREAANERQQLRRWVAQGVMMKIDLTDKSVRGEDFHHVEELTVDNQGSTRGVFNNISFKGRQRCCLCRHVSSFLDKHAHCAQCYVDKQLMVKICCLTEDGSDWCVVGKMMCLPHHKARQRLINMALNKVSEAGYVMKKRDRLATKITNQASACKRQFELDGRFHYKLTPAQQKIWDQGTEVRTPEWLVLEAENSAHWAARFAERAARLKFLTDDGEFVMPLERSHRYMAKVYLGEIIFDQEQWETYVIPVKREVMEGDEDNHNTYNAVWGSIEIKDVSDVSDEEGDSGPVTSGTTSGDDDVNLGAEWNASFVPAMVPNAMFLCEQDSVEAGHSCYRTQHNSARVKVLGEKAAYEQRHSAEDTTLWSKELKGLLDEALRKMGERMLDDVEPRPAGWPGMRYDTNVDNAWNVPRFDKYTGHFNVKSLQFPGVKVPTKHGKVNDKFCVSHIDICYLEQLGKFAATCSVRLAAHLEAIMDMVNGDKSWRKRALMEEHVDGALSENQRMLSSVLEEISYILFMRRREYIFRHNLGISREKAVEFLSQPVDTDNVLLKGFDKWITK